jgi:hypothetical protein
MDGIYRVFKDGQLVLEKKNKLTILGRSNALKAMLGLTQSFASSLGIGVSEKSNGSTTFVEMTDLDFSVGQYPITSSSLGETGAQDALIFTARITDPSRYVIRELGLYSNKLTGSAENTTDVLFGFEAGDPLKETISSVAYYIDDADKPAGGASTIFNTTDTSVITGSVTYGSQIRLGSYAVKLVGANKQLYFDDSSLNLNSIAPYDEIVLAAYFVANAAITVKFESGASDYATYTFTPGGTGYKVISVLKSSGANTGSVDWSKIVKVTISNGGSSTTTMLDGIRIKRVKPIDSNDGLVSRAVLSATDQIIKDFGSVIDVQYILTMKMETGT